MTLQCIINKKPICVEIASHLTLLQLLREVLHMTGTKEGCGEGECGACTVLVNGENVNSCLYPAIQVQGKEVVTIEGIEEDAELSAIQQSFLSHGAVQCGFCTPGMVISAKALLDKNPNPSEEEIRRALSGNLCRCTGYQAIVDAVQGVNKK